MKNFTFEYPVCELDDGGNFKIPEDTTSLWFDVGTSFTSPNSIQYLKRNPNGFVLGFEPDPRMYFSIFAAQQFAENLWLLDNSHETANAEREKRKQNALIHSFFSDNTEEFIPTNELFKRYILFPCAVSNEESVSSLKISDHHGSSSLMTGWKVVAKHPVKTIRLETILDKIPDRFEYIDHLKIDAEGMDSEVVLSCSNSINKFVVVTSEMRIDSLMNTLGFEYIKGQNFAHSYVNISKKDLLKNVDYMVRG